MAIELTPEAVAEGKRMVEREKREGLALRVGVKGGGCSGLSYFLEFDQPKEKDIVLEYDGLRVLIDPKSDLYLSGTKVDFMDTLQEKGFRFINPNAAKSCGCGESFSV